MMTLKIRKQILLVSGILFMFVTNVAWASLRGCSVGNDQCIKLHGMLMAIGIPGALFYAVLKSIFENSRISKVSSTVRKKNKKTLKILHDLALQDEKMRPELLIKKARETFLTFQACWLLQNFAPMEKTMARDLFLTFSELVNNKGTCQRPKLSILYIDFVDANSESFTVLITAINLDPPVKVAKSKIVLMHADNDDFLEYWQFGWNELGWQINKIDQSE